MKRIAKDPNICSWDHGSLHGRTHSKLLGDSHFLRQISSVFAEVALILIILLVFVRLCGTATADFARIFTRQDSCRDVKGV